MTTPRIDQHEKNLVINGNFDIWQRNTSLSITASQFVADRFRTFNNGTFASVGTVSQGDVPTVAQSGYQSRYSHLITKTGAIINPAAADYYYHSHKIEGHDYQQIHGAKNIRIQFWVKSNVTGTYTVGLTNSANTRSYAAEYTVLASNTWEKKTIDVVTDNSGTWLFDNGTGLEVGFVLSAGSNYKIAPGAWTTTAGLGVLPASTNQVNWAGLGTTTIFQLAQVMVIPNNFSNSTGVDVPFQRAGRSISEELRMCQRYYEKSYDMTVNPATVTAVGACRVSIVNAVSGNTHASDRFRVSKKGVPTTVIYSPSTGAAANVSASTNNAAIADYAILSTSGGENGVQMVFSGFSATTDHADIMFHWTADAEL